MDLGLLEKFLEEECCFSEPNDITEITTGRRVGAIMIVHVQGHMCDMQRLLAICERFGLPLIEDAAESLGATFDGVQSGTLADVGCFSFNGNKIMSTGGGGMLVARDERLLSRARHLATTAKTDQLRYFHDEIGYNYRLVNVLAAIGVAQLEQLDKFLAKKKR